MSSLTFDQNVTNLFIALKRLRRYVFSPAAPGLHFVDVRQGALIGWIFQVVVNDGLHLVLIILGSNDC